MRLQRHSASLPRIFSATLVLGALTFTAKAQSTHVHPTTSTDATWAKVYATSCPDWHHACPLSSNGYENAFNGDPRLPALLKRSLPQRESWWYNSKAGSEPVSSIVQQFIGVPGDLIVDDDRYVTATGCVPHNCTTHGMLWIDTARRPAAVIFIATEDIQDFTSRTTHLWIYCSSRLSFECLPDDMLSSLNRWHTSIVNPKYDPQHIVVVTVVQPNGRERDLAYDMLFYKQYESKHLPSGATQ